MNKIWSDSDIALLKAKYEDGMLVEDIQKMYFPNLTYDQIKSKTSRLHLKHKNSRGWSSELDNILRDVYPYYSNSEIHDKFIPNKSVRAIQSHAVKIGLQKQGVVWTEDEDDLLKEIYKSYKVDELVDKFENKTANAISERAKLLGLKTEHGIWTKNELEILDKYYISMGSKKLVQSGLLNTHTEAQITCKANSIGLKRRNFVPWTEEEKIILAEYYDYYSYDYLIENFFPHRTLCQITNMMKELGLKKTKKTRDGKVFWTDDRTSLLYNYYPFMNTEEFYDKYFSNDISMSAMYAKIVSLNIKKDDNFNITWTDKQLQIIKENYSNLDIPIEEIAEMCGKTVHQVGDCANRILGIARKVRLFSDEEENLIRELYPNNRTKDFIHLFPNRTVEQLDRYAVRMGVHKTKDYIRMVTLDGTRNSLETSIPQQIINNVLEEMNIKYTPEFDCKYYLIDHYLDDKHLMIEVQGDYWHCSPLLKNRVSDTQGVKSNVIKDKRKHTYIKNKYNIEVLYLWETDIMNHLELCRDLIKLYVTNNGKLGNYHSFNYEYDNNGNLQVIQNKYVIGY